MQNTITINSALTEQVASLLTELGFEFGGDEVIAHTTIRFNNAHDVAHACNVIADHFGDSAILSSSMFAA